MSAPTLPDHEVLLAAALGYAGRGWAVLPLHHPTSSGCSCGRGDCRTPAKHPRNTHGVTEATKEPARIRLWWRRWPQANVAIATGAISGLVVVDVDPRHGGDESIHALEAKHGVAPTLEVATGGGGRHLYFRHPGGLVTNKVGVAPGVDVRGDGGYVVAPPSIHMSGQAYRWSP